MYVQLYSVSVISYITKNLGGKTKPNDLSKGLFRQVCYTQSVEY